MTPGATAVAVALSGVLSSGLTAAYLRATEPETTAIDGDMHVTPEQRHLAAMLVAPGLPFTRGSGGEPLTATDLGTTPLGFQSGWQEAFRSRDEQQVTTFLLRFDGPAAARSYAQGAGRIAAAMTSPEPFLVSGVPGASGLADTTKDSDGHYLQAVVLHRGTHAALLLFTTEQARPGSLVADLAQRQWAALGP